MVITDFLSELRVGEFFRRTLDKNPPHGRWTDQESTEREKIPETQVSQSLF